MEWIAALWTTSLIWISKVKYFMNNKISKEFSKGNKILFKKVEISIKFLTEIIWVGKEWTESKHNGMVKIKKKL